MQLWKKLDGANAVPFILRDAAIGGGWLTKEASSKSMTELIHETYDGPLTRAAGA